MTIYGLCSIIGVSVLSFFSHKIKRRTINITCFTVLSLVALTFLLFRDYQKDPVLGKWLFSLTCIMRVTNDIGFCLLFNYLAELFPTKIRAFTSGLMVYAGRMTNTLGPSIMLLSDKSGIHPCFICSIPCFFGLISSYLLPETLNQKLIT